LQLKDAGELLDHPEPLRGPEPQERTSLDLLSMVSSSSKVEERGGAGKTFEASSGPQTRESTETAWET